MTTPQQVLAVLATPRRVSTLRIPAAGSIGPTQADPCRTVSGRTDCRVGLSVSSLTSAASAQVGAASFSEGRI